ncbi:MAG: hypothetical protein U1F53_21150 [Burkholderiaceae bacterium]
MTEASPLPPGPAGPDTTGLAPEPPQDPAAPPPAPADDTPADEAEAPPPLARPGQRLGPWMATRRLGQGAEAEVYMAGRADDGPRELVALRIYRETAPAAAALPRLAALRAAAARLPAQAFFHFPRDEGLTPDGRLYVATALAEGQPIDEATRALSLEDRLRQLLPLVDALGLLHRHLLVHGGLRASVLRVLPPPPVLAHYGAVSLEGPPEPEPTPLGAIQVLETGLAPALAGPEALPPSTAVDLRALGLLMRQVLVVDGEPPLPADLQAIVDRAIASDDDGAGYTHAGAVAVDLRAFADGERVTAVDDTPRYRLERFAQRHRLAVVTGALAGGLLLLAAVGGAWQATQATRALYRTEARLQALRALTRDAVFQQADLLAALPGGAAGQGPVRQTVLAQLGAIEQEAGDDAAWLALLTGAYARIAEQLATVGGNPALRSEATAHAQHALALGERAWPARQHDPVFVAAYALALQERAAGQPQAQAHDYEDALARIDHALADAPPAARRPLRLRQASLWRAQARLPGVALPRALSLCEQAELSLRALDAAQPDAAVGEQLAGLYAQRSRLQEQVPRPDRALADAQAAWRLRQRLLAAAPLHASHRAALVDDAAATATLALAAGQSQLALEAGQSAHDEWQTLLRDPAAGALLGLNGSAGATARAGTLGPTLAGLLGRALVATGQAAPALPLLAKALAPLDAAWSRATDPALAAPRAELMLAQARAMLALGDANGARSRLAAVLADLAPWDEQPGARAVWLLMGEAQLAMAPLEPRRRADWLQRAAASYARAHAQQPLQGEALRSYQQAGGRA